MVGSSVSSNRLLHLRSGEDRTTKRETRDAVVPPLRKAQARWMLSPLPSQRAIDRPSRIRFAVSAAGGGAGRAGASFADSARGEFEVIVQRDVMVAMRDGVRLATDVYLPARNGSRWRNARRSSWSARRTASRARPGATRARRSRISTRATATWWCTRTAAAEANPRASTSSTSATATTATTAAPGS